MLRHSGTCDEIAHHIPAGYVILEKGDFKIDTSHPPLSRYIVALPLKLLLHPNLPSDKAQWRIEDRSVFGKQFFFELNTDSRKIILFSRLGVVVIGILTGIFLFLFTKKLYGSSAAILSLFLFALCPNMIAHSGLSTTDMVAACFMLLSLYTFWNFWENPSLFNTLIAGAGLGLAQLSKYSLILLYAIFFIFLVITRAKSKRGIFSKFFLLSFFSVFILWLGYGFEFTPMLRDAMRTEEKFSLLTKLTLGFISPNQLKYLLFNLPIPLGSHILGILGLIHHGQEGHGTYFMGQLISHGNKMYFLVAYLIKTPLAGIILFFSSLIFIIRSQIQEKEVFLLLNIIVFFVAASLSNLQLGLRYILPIYPLLFIISAASINEWVKKGRKATFAILIFWYIIAAMSTWPNHLSYFNELIGGADNGWKYMRDSNIDWGQDLPALAKYQKLNKIEIIVLEYFGQDKPEIYGIRWQPLQADDKLKPQDKVYAISAQYIDIAQWTKNIKPTAKAGKSIFIYDFRNEK